LSRERPHLFLDVDGVLNAFDFLPGQDSPGFDDFEVHHVAFEGEDGFSHSFALFISSSMGARLAALGADITWVTTWEHRADSHIAPLCDLPRDLPVLTKPRQAADPWGGWKFHEVRRAVERDPKPFVWVDDDIDSFRSGAMTPRDWAAGISTPSLLIAPDPSTGLLPEHLDLIETFLAQHQSQDRDGPGGSNDTARS
jgi:hypothetical protein